MSLKPVCAPVAVFVYKRAHTTARVMETVRRADPSRLFIIADGPRSAAEADDCAAARRAAESLAPDCPTTKIYSETNLGLCPRIKSGLDRVFDEVERAIILEDDCVPTSSFYDNCSQLLDEFSGDTRIFQIGGFNYAPQLRYAPHEFIASKYCLIWGWATWRRSWRQYRSLLGDALPDSMLDGVKACCQDPVEIEYWSSVFRLIASGGFSDWAAEWMLACWLSRGLSLLPKVPLVSNVGFEPSATHTTGERPYWVGEGELLRGCRLPSPLARDLHAETVVFDHVFGGWHSKESWFWRLLFHHARPVFHLMRGHPSTWALKRSRRPRG